MPVSELYGEIIDGTQVEAAVLDTLTLWEPLYLREIELQKDLDPEQLPAFRSRFTVSEDEPERWPEDQLPALVVAAPGVVGNPLKDGEGAYRATFSVEVGVIVSAADDAATNRLAKWYAAAVRGILAQHSSLDGFARGLDWLGEDYDRDIPRANDRTLRATVLTFGVEVSALVYATKGPLDPDEDDFPYTAEQVDVVATKETI